MHRGMAAGRPTAASLDEIRVRDFADHELTRLDIRPLHLHVALETEIIITLHQKLPINRTMGIMASGATVPERLVLKNERPALLAMTLGATLVKPRHGESSGGLHD